MRFATWNCQGGVAASKLHEFEQLGADIGVLSECERLPLQPNIIWVGDEGKKGLGIIAGRGWKLRRITEIPDLPRFVVPITVEGTSTFLLLAVWTKAEGVDKYVRGLNRAVNVCERLIASSPTVVLGDFNSNSVWDQLHPRDRNHTALVERLKKLGLVSAYHAHTNEDQGMETSGTFFMYRRILRPYHIDYCFLPVDWASQGMTVEIGAFER
jgi:hypothetical protein